MMDSFITKFLIGGVFFSLFVGIFLTVMVDMGSQYGINNANANVDLTNNIQSELLQENIQGQELLQQAGLNDDLSDLSSASEYISASENALSTQTLLTNSTTQLQKLLPYNSSINTAIFTILGILFLSAAIYLVLGRGR